MKKYKYLFVVIAAIVFAACDKSLETVEPSFDIIGYTTADGIDSLGNPVKNVTFNFNSEANILSFYSGEVLKDYAFRGGRVINYSSLLMSFTSTIQFGTQPNQLSVWASTDFDGIYSPANINAANWDPITDRFLLASVVGSTTPVPSGVMEISDLKVEGRPLYIAFKYVTEPQAIAGTQNTWRIRNFSLTGESDLGVMTLANQTSAGWLIVNEGEIIDANRAGLESESGIMLRGNNINKEIKTTSWAISQGFNTSSSDLGPDRPVNIKTYIDPELRSYTHSYTEPGTYNVAFVAQNSTLKENKQVVRTMSITID